MDDSPFIDLVAKMRAMQRDYFRTRLAKFLEASRRLENEVDEAIERAFDSQQAELFPSQGPNGAGE